MHRTLLASAAFAASSSAIAQPESIVLQNTNAATYGAVRVANSPDLEPQQFTIEVRIGPNGAGYEGSDAFGNHVITKFAEGQGVTFASGYAIRWSPTTQRVNFAIAHAFDGSGINLFSNADVAVGTYARITATFDGAVAKIYINGTLDTQSATGFSSVYYTNADLRFGAGNGPGGFSRRFEGLIDDVRLWNRALTASEIAANASCEAIAPSPGLVGAWSFTGGSYADLSGLGHNGTPEGNVALVAQPNAWSTPAFITMQPAPQATCPGGTRTFSVAAVGSGQLGYQWQLQPAPGAAWQNLTEGINSYHGHPTLDIQNATATTVKARVLWGIGGNLNLRCVVSNDCGAAVSASGPLNVCIADFNCDGQVEDADFVIFVNAYNILDCADPTMPEGCPTDLNGDNVVDDADFSIFVVAYDALECP